MTWENYFLSKQKTRIFL